MLLLVLLTAIYTAHLLEQSLSQDEAIYTQIQALIGNSHNAFTTNCTHLCHLQAQYDTLQSTFGISHPIADSISLQETHIYYAILTTEWGLSLFTLLNRTLSLALSIHIYEDKCIPKINYNDYDYISEATIYYQITLSQSIWETYSISSIELVLISDKYVYLFDGWAYFYMGDRDTGWIQIFRILL